MNRKSDAILRLAEGLLRRGVPLHGIGLQAHLTLAALPNWRSVGRNLARLARLGLACQFTEVDVRIPKPVTAAKLRAQADAYRRLVDAARAAGNCAGIVLWGFSDRWSWVPGFFRGDDAALVFDRRNRPKPAYRALRAALARPR